MKWCDRDLWQCRYAYGLCLSEKDFRQEMKRMNVAPHQTPSWISDGANATTHFLEHPDGNKAAIVCIDGSDKNMTGIQVASILVHEAVHIWQEHRDAIGEQKPGSESEAYAIQSISHRLMEAYVQKGKEMSSWLIVATGLAYAYVALEQGMKGNISMTVVYAGYAFSNIGLYLMAK